MSSVDGADEVEDDAVAAPDGLERFARELRAQLVAAAERAVDRSTRRCDRTNRPAR